MPTFRVETPDGKVFRVETPETPQAPERPTIAPTVTSGGMASFGAGMARATPSSGELGLPTLQEFRQTLREQPIASAALGISPEFGAEMGGQAVGAAAGRVLGTRFGGPVGGRVGSGMGRIVGGAMSGAGAETLGQKIRGEKTTPAINLLVNFLPEALESSVRLGARSLARVSKGGQEIRMDEAAQRLLTNADTVFNSPGRRQAGALFDRVRDLGVQIDTQQLSNIFAALPQGRLQDVIQLDIIPVDRAARSGRRIADIFDTVQQGQSVDMADLQDLRSALMKRANATKDPQASALLDTLRIHVDNAIDSAPARPRPGQGPQSVPQARDLLATGRRQWQRVRAAEDFANLIGSRPITRVARSGNTVQFDINRLDNMLRDAQAGRGTPLARTFLQSLDRVQGARENFEALLRDIRQVTPGRINLSDTQGARRIFVLAALDNMFADVMTHPIGQRLLRRTIVEGRGNLSFNVLAGLVNEMRRQDPASLGMSPRPPFPETASQPIGIPR